MPHPKLLPTKDKRRGYKVEIPGSLSSTRKRQRRFFSTLEAAEEFIRRFKNQQHDLGTSIRILKPAETIDADRAISLLKRHSSKHGIRRPNLYDVALEWIDRWKEQHKTISVKKLFEQYLASRSGDSAKHRLSLHYTANKFANLHSTKVSELGRYDIEDCLEKLPPASFNAHLRRVKSVLNYGVKHGWLAKNPALLVEPIKRPRQSVKILPVETVELMLRTAQAHTPGLLPFLCTSLFCGVRPEELNRIEWRDFNLPDKKLIIRPEVSKTNQPRTVDLSDNMIEWLNTFDRGEGSSRVMQGWTRGILTPTRNRLWRFMREQQPTLAKHAPHNCLRHDYVSFYLAQNNNDINTLVIQSGHSSAVMFRHYLSIVSKADAVKYWALRP